MIAFSRAISGLRVAEQNLYVTSNNLSNVNTEGYHRQRLVQSTFRPGNTGGYQVGMGVDASEVIQIKMDYLENNYRNELPKLGRYQLEEQVYNSLQSIIGSDGSSVQERMSSLWESFNELAKEYTTSIAGGYLRENAVALVAEFGAIEEQLTKMQTELDGEVKEIVSKINDYSRQIANLNDRITDGEAGGIMCCELRDSRTSIINELANLIDIEVEDFSDSCVNIRIGNGHLVVGTGFNALSTAQTIPQSTFCYPVWAENGQAIELESGKLKGVLDMRGENVAGNYVSPTNGNPKEKMDIVVSIDKELSLANIEAMRNTMNTLLATMDRQSTDYQFYTNLGTKIKGEDLKLYSDYLYGTKMQEIVNDYTGNNNSFVDFISSVDGQCNPEQVIKEYMEHNGINLEKLKNNFKGNQEILDLIDTYEINGGNSVIGFQMYLNKLNGMDVNKAAVQTYVEGTGLSIAGLGNYINDNMVDLSAKDLARVDDLMSASYSNVLNNVSYYDTFREYRKDSNKYMLVFTDETIYPGTDIENIAGKLNDIDMRLIAVTPSNVASNWRMLAEETDGNVYDIKDFETEAGAEEIGLKLSRDLNSRLNDTDSTDGIPAFRAGLNQFINALTKEINAIFRQGANVYGNRHGDIVKDQFGNDVINQKTGEAETYNLDLFLKIDENLPLQMGNIAINPAFSDLNNMPLSYSGDTGDFEIGNMLVKLTTTDIFSNGNEYSTADEHYADFILNFAQAANVSVSGLKSQESIVNAASEKMLSVSGVSMDEELGYMLKYQHSYTAASKLINIIDEMLETVINI